MYENKRQTTLPELMMGGLESLRICWSLIFILSDRFGFRAILIFFFLKDNKNQEISINI